MLKSIYQNGGFYVGKYETGRASSSSSTPVIKEGTNVYSSLTCKEAQTLASSMESGEYTSNLLFGVQWDLVLKYLEVKAVEKGTTLSTIQSQLNSDSTDWGNYVDKGNRMISTGSNSSYSKQGIYDVAGNAFEFTLEYTSNAGQPCAVRGGSYNYGGMVFPASSRMPYYTITGADFIGFRVTIY